MIWQIFAVVNYMVRKFSFCSNIYVDVSQTFTLYTRGIISTTGYKGIERIPKIKRQNAMHFLKFLISFVLEYFINTSIRYNELLEHVI